MSSVVVRFGAPAEVVFDYLTTPANRPDWQSSLRRVVVLDAGPAHVGQRWIDVTVAGIRPQMQTVVLQRATCWTESGSWRGIEAVGELRFADADRGCMVTATARVTVGGWLRPIGPSLTRASALVLRPDLERAARILSARPSNQ